MELEPFRVAVPDEQIEALRTRLSVTDWADDFGNDDWRYGVPGGYLRELVDYWIDGFDWRAQESAMNAYPHIRTVIDGVPIHALHEPGSGPDPIPLVLTHGWPWTFWDFAKVIGPLAHPERHGGDQADSFHVVVPSLPGFVFSSPMRTIGIGWPATAAMWVELMARLGYPRFGAQGGDWGAFVTAQLGHEHAHHLIGAHLSFPALLSVDLAGISRDEFGPDEVHLYDEEDHTPRNLTHLFTHMFEPQTIAWAMHDSPVGLAAWMLQRRHNWSDCDDHVEQCFTKDELITSFCLYLFTGTFGTAARYYAESFGVPWTPAHDRVPTIEAPTGVAVFPREIVHLPRTVAEQHANLHHWTVMPEGGHFAPSEQPDRLIDDIRAFFRPLR